MNHLKLCAGEGAGTVATGKGGHWAGQHAPSPLPTAPLEGLFQGEQLMAHFSDTILGTPGPIHLF